MYLCGEDLPEETNRVELDWEHQDRFGLPGVRTHYTLGDNSRRVGTDMIAHGPQVLNAAGASSVRDFGLSPIWGWHLLGTARMGTDPRTSVVDGSNQAHYFFFSSRRRHTRSLCDWSSDVCSSD